MALVAYDVLLELSSTELYDAGLKVSLLFLSPLPFFVARPEVVDEGLNVDLVCNFRLGCYRKNTNKGESHGKKRNESNRIESNRRKKTAGEMNNSTQKLSYLPHDILWNRRRHKCDGHQTCNS